jgi:hypothetical protein
MKTKITALENQVFQALLKELYAEIGFSDVTVTDLSKKTGLPVNCIKGVVGSLVKKNIFTVEVGNEYEKTEFVNLDPSYYDCHPQWCNDRKYYQWFAEIEQNQVEVN